MTFHSTLIRNPRWFPSDQDLTFELLIPKFNNIYRSPLSASFSFLFAHNFSLSNQFARILTQPLVQALLFQGQSQNFEKHLVHSDCSVGSFNAWINNFRPEILSPFCPLIFPDIFVTQCDTPLNTYCVVNSSLSMTRLICLYSSFYLIPLICCLRDMSICDLMHTRFTYERTSLGVRSGPWISSNLNVILLI